MHESTAVVFEGIPGALATRRVSTPVPRGREIVVRVLGCTLCGSDLHSFAGRRSVAVPTVLGHEIVGRIEEFAPDSPRRDWNGEPLEIGDRVTWAVVAACGRCYSCSHDLWPKCSLATKYGHERFEPGRELLGGLASHLLLVENTAIVKLPDSLPLEVACPANCATATVAAAVEAAGDLRGATVGVLGSGLLGLTTCAMATTRGAAAVLAVDRSADRLAIAHGFGATRTMLPDSFPYTVRTTTEGRGVDVLIELTGSTAALESAWPQVRIGGTIVLVGAVFPDRALTIVPEQIVRHHLTIRGIHNYSPRHLVEAVRFLAETQARYPFAELVSAWIPLSETAKAFALAEHSENIRIGVLG